MTHKFVLSATAAFALSLVSASALADVPMPECVNNPACQQPGGCSVSTLPVGAPVGAGLAAIAAALAFAARRRWS